MNEYFKPECEAQVNNQVIVEIVKNLNVQKLQVPAYYKDKKQHELSKSLLESLGYKAETLALGYIVFKEEDYKVAAINTIVSWCNKNTSIRPKMLDDTQLVICSRLVHLVFAAKYLKSEMSPEEISTISQWINKIFIPSCEYLTKSIWHRTSNHGAWGLLGLAAAYDFLGNQSEINKISSKVLSHIKSATKQPWYTKVFGKYTSGKSEYWVENIRTKSGLYYTYYHTAPILKLVEILSSNGINVTSIADSIKPIIDQLYLYATDTETWPYMKQSGIPGIKQLQQLIFPSAKEFRDLFPNGKSAVLFYAATVVYSTRKYLPWISDEPLNQDGPWRHSSVLKEHGLIKQP
jgi:hypothetical protein